jgi:hypothetical protein
MWAEVLANQSTATAAATTKAYLVQSAENSFFNQRFRQGTPENEATGE